MLQKSGHLHSFPKVLHDYTASICLLGVVLIFGTQLCAVFLQALIADDVS